MAVASANAGPAQVSTLISPQKQSAASATAAAIQQQQQYQHAHHAQQQQQQQQQQAQQQATNGAHGTNVYYAAIAQAQAQLTAQVQAQQQVAAYAQQQQQQQQMNLIPQVSEAKNSSATAMNGVFLLVRSDAICDSARYSTANVLHVNRWPGDLSSRWPKLRSCPSSSECDSCRTSGHVLRWSIPAQRERSSGSTAALFCVSTAAAADCLSNRCRCCSRSTHCCRISDAQCCLQSQCFVSPTIVGRCGRRCSTAGPTRSAFDGHASGTPSSIPKLRLAFSVLLFLVLLAVFFLNTVFYHRCLLFSFFFWLFITLVTVGYLCLIVSCISENFTFVCVTFWSNCLFTCFLAPLIYSHKTCTLRIRSASCFSLVVLDNETPSAVDSKLTSPMECL